MKRVRLIGILLVLVVGAFYAISGIAAEPKDQITLDHMKKMMAPVDLPHKAHTEKFGRQCVDCHHTLKAGEQAQTCRACHDPAKADGKKVALKDAYHNKCKACHEKVNAEQGKKAPAKCNECHVKK